MDVFFLLVDSLWVHFFLFGSNFQKRKEIGKMELGNKFSGHSNRWAFLTKELWEGRYEREEWSDDKTDGLFQEWTFSLAIESAFDMLWQFYHKILHSKCANTAVDLSPTLTLWHKESILSACQLIVQWRKVNSIQLFLFALVCSSPFYIH